MELFSFDALVGLSGSFVLFLELDFTADILNDFRELFNPPASNFQGTFLSFSLRGRELSEETLECVFLFRVLARNLLSRKSHETGDNVLM